MTVCRSVPLNSEIIQKPLIIGRCGVKIQISPVAPERIRRSKGGTHISRFVISMPGGSYKQTNLEIVIPQDLYVN